MQSVDWLPIRSVKIPFLLPLVYSLQKSRSFRWQWYSLFIWRLPHRLVLQDVLLSDTVLVMPVNNIVPSSAFAMYREVWKRGFLAFLPDKPIHIERSSAHDFLPDNVQAVLFMWLQDQISDCNDIKT